MAKGKSNRSNVDKPERIGFARVLLELAKAALTGAIRAVVSHWFEH